MKEISMHTHAVKDKSVFKSEFKTCKKALHVNSKIEAAASSSVHVNVHVLALVILAFVTATGF